jgi:hypothetical protein
LRQGPGAAHWGNTVKEFPAVRRDIPHIVVTTIIGDKITERLKVPATRQDAAIILRNYHQQRMGTGRSVCGNRNVYFFVRELAA